MCFDMVICNGMVVMVSDIFVSDVGIKDGWIVVFVVDLMDVGEVIDVMGFFVFFGGIDSYVYFDQLLGDGIVMVDDFDSGIWFVVIGGNMIVFVFCMQEKGQFL